MSYDPFGPWANQAANDTGRISQLIDTFLASKPLPQSSHLNSSQAEPRTQNQPQTASNTTKTEAAPQIAISSMLGTGIMIVGGLALLAYLLQNDSHE